MIHIVDSDPAMLLRFRLIFFRFGIHSDGCNYRKLDCLIEAGKVSLVFLVSPFSPDKPPRLCQTLRSKYPALPVVSLLDKSHAQQTLPDPSEYIIRPPYSPASMVEQLLKIRRDATGLDPVHLAAYGAADNIFLDCPTFFGTPLPLTRIERSILRYLISISPRTADAAEILYHCTKPGSTPMANNVPTHICRINRKSSELMNRRVIECLAGTGYKIAEHL